MSKMLEGKNYVIMGVLNRNSIAYGIAKMLHHQGAKLLFTYPSENLKERVQDVATEFAEQPRIFECNVTNDDQIAKAFHDMAIETDGQIDGVLHAIAFSDKNELQGKYMNTSRLNFLNTMDISCFSLAAIARVASPYMAAGGSILTLTYEGSRRVFPNYNVMGVAKAALEASVRYLASDLGDLNIRVNAISAGPIRTLAASGITGFKSMLKADAQINILKRNTTLEDVAGCALMLLSNLGSGITGEVIHVDCGYHAVGMCSSDTNE